MTHPLKLFFNSYNIKAAVGDVSCMCEPYLSTVYEA